MLRYCLYAITIGLALACQPDGQVDSKKIKTEMRERAVFHITDDELMQAADNLGRKVSLNLDSLIKSGSNKENHSESCVNKYNNRISNLEIAGIKCRLIHDSTAIRLTLNDKEKQVLEAAEFTCKSWQSLPPTIQNVGERRFAFVAETKATPEEISSCGINSGKTHLGKSFWFIQIETKPAALEAQKNKKGMM